MPGNPHRPRRASMIRGGAPTPISKQAVTRERRSSLLPSPMRSPNTTVATRSPRSGQLQAALAAYDSALNQAPADKDIRHNRDLVERALRQQQQQRQQQKGQHQSPKSSSRNGQQGSQAGTSQGQQPQSSSVGRQGSSGARQSGGTSQQSRAAGSQSTGSDQSAAAGSQTGADRRGNSGQAQRDAADAAALARAQRQRRAAANTAQGRASEQNGKTADSDSLLAGGTQTPKPKPESERQMALEQWLRQIPDSPAGLLRRKFLIEHIIRQQDGGKSLESTQ